MRMYAKTGQAKASKEGFEMVMLPNWLDAKCIPIENWSGDEEIPKVGKNRRSSGKSRLLSRIFNLTIALQKVEYRSNISILFQSISQGKGFSKRSCM